jgi:hypothetical protein
MFSCTAQVSHQICQGFFFKFSSVCLLVRVTTMVDKKQGCRLLFGSHIGLNVIRKEEKRA